MQQDRFEYGVTYHICNRGINGEDIFKEEKNYTYFLSLMKRHLVPVTDVYAYSKSINKIYQRTGNLFQRHPKRNKVNDKEYFMQLVVYIHLNPIKHKFSRNLNYPHSSYQAIISDKPTNLDRKTVIDYFDDVDNLIFWHDFSRLQHRKVKELIEEDY
jgi:REP element-mobilizing transposase RayT